ncbi:MAG TPA: NAD-dependent epimerase/dehydratase family protein [Bacteroidetes bacterium]|nr:NAD-dependent epimerase/dehydratase family protein [Bacteroidota bacterium]
MDFAGKSLMITGGTGSFGNAVLRRFLDTDIAEIRIFSRDEKKQDDMRQFYRNNKIKYFIGDVRVSNSINNAIRGVDYVFHAAALKQVPSCEFFPMEAVKTNVLGCENVLNSAIRHNINRVIVLSTDKAVYPINAMGMSKALSEKVMVAKSRDLNGTGITFCGTRYGNVMASRGSVIPLFINQIRNRQPITITDPAMTRFMMTLEEAVELVLYAFDNGSNGDIYVQKSPATTIETLAYALKEIYQSEVDVKIIGTRHGEKLFETLVNREEMVKAIDEGDYFRIPADTRDLNYNKFFTEGEENVSSALEYTSHNTTQLNLEETKKLLLKLSLIREDVMGEKKGLTYEP